MPLHCRSLIELGDFCRDDTPLGSVKLWSSIFYLAPSSSELALNWGLSNCNAIRHVAPERMGDYGVERLVIRFVSY